MNDKKEVKKNVQWVKEDNCYIFECPTCEIPVQVLRDQVNCQIFRHGQMKNTYTIRFLNNLTKRVNLNDIVFSGNNLAVGATVMARENPEVEHASGKVVAVHEGRQIPPHTSELICNKLIADNLIWGCGKPFRLLLNTDGHAEYAVKCGYI